MKIVFRNLPEGEGTVKVSLDGGNTFIDHQINTVRENGIPLTDNQDYSKILIKGSANILKNLDILSSVKVDGGVAQSTGIPYTYEKPVYGLGTVTYKCYAYDKNTDGQITNDDDIPNYNHLWVKNIGGKDTVYSIDHQSGLTTDVSNLVKLSELKLPLPASSIANITINEDLVVFAGGNYIRYPEGDLTNEVETVVGTETVTETIKFIQDPPTVTENGTVIADEGKAFKLADVEVPKSELGFKCFYNYAPEHYFGEVPQAAQALDSGKRNYNILMSNDYLKNLCRASLGRAYSGVVGIYNDGDRQGFVSNHYTLESEYNLFEYYTNVGADTLLLYFYDNLTSQDSFSTVRVSLIDGSRIVPDKDLLN